MARNLTSGMVIEVKASFLRPVLFVEINSAAGPVRAWTGLGDFQWDGKTWNGVGNLLGISRISETLETQANGVSINLSGIPAEAINLVLANARIGLLGSVYIGAFDESGSIVVDPFKAYRGRVDVPVIETSDQTSIVRINLERFFIDGKRAVISRYTGEDQKRVHPADLGFDSVTLAQWWDGVWGFGAPSPVQQASSPPRQPPFPLNVPFF